MNKIKRNGKVGGNERFRTDMGDYDRDFSR